MDEKQVHKRLEELSKNIQTLLSESREHRESNFVATSDDNVISQNLLPSYEALLAEQRYYQTQSSLLENETISKVIPYEQKDMMEDVETVKPVEVVQVKERKIPFYMQLDEAEVPSLIEPKEVPVFVEDETVNTESLEDVDSSLGKGHVLAKTLDSSSNFDIYEEPVIEPVSISFEEPIEVVGIDVVPEILAKQYQNDMFAKYVGKIVMTHPNLNIPQQSNIKTVGGR